MERNLLHAILAVLLVTSLHFGTNFSPTMSDFAYTDRQPISTDIGDFNSTNDGTGSGSSSPGTCC